VTNDEQHTQPVEDGEARRKIARLAIETLPRLIERLNRSELGELEVREDGWRIRLRRATGLNDGVTGAAPEARDRVRASSATGSAAHQDRTASHRGAAARRPESDRGLVTSPAVGYFIAREDVSVGTPVMRGDVIGQVDVLGVSQEVVAPVDGTIGSFDVEPGQAIEFGQPVARVEKAGSRAAAEPMDAEGEALGQLVEA
jgi:acetyl-CoA carboxylase biotin carboxyl carrier protein